jgi:hypothetical protein
VIAPFVLRFDEDLWFVVCGDDHGHQILWFSTRRRPRRGWIDAPAAPKVKLAL